MPKHITEKTFYHYLKCPSWVYFDAHEAERAHDALLSQLIDDGLLLEVQREILKDKSFVEVEHEDQEEAYARTLQLMKAGEQTILRGVLIHGHWIGHPDILERVEGKSKLGAYYYIACDIKRDRQIKDVYKFQGCFYAEILEYAQGTKPTRGYVMNPDGAILGYEIEAFETEFHLTLEEIERIMAGQRPPHFLTTGCRQSPWFETCKNESVVCDDLSLINRIWRSEVEELKLAGINSIRALAASDPDLLTAKVEGLSRDRLHHLRMQAVSLAEHRTIVMRSVDFPPAQEELYFDIESDPLRDLDFLFGVLHVLGKEETFYSFVADKPSKEEEAWWAFCKFLEGHPTAIIYHFGWYEIEVVRRLAIKYGNVAQIDRVVSEQMNDLLSLIRDDIIFPLHFYSLKDIAKLLGFSWREAEVSGVNAVQWYEEYLAKHKKEILQKIIDYNEDDCRATRVVKEWCEKNAAE
ncbi:MAG: TM0106 family RecB-like putative nuclease [Patescibacteria group bacterium]